MCVCMCVCVDCIYPDRDRYKWVAGSCEGSNKTSGDQIREISRIAKALTDSLSLSLKKKDCALWR